MLISDWSSDVCASDLREVIRKVVNISSMAGTHGNAGQVNYSSAKAAVTGMTKTLSKEWGRLKVCVNCVAFGFIDTRLTKAQDDPETRIEIEGEAIQAGVPSAVLGALKRSEEHTSELQSLMRISSAVFCLKTKTN